MKKTLAFILGLLLCLTLFAVSGMAEESEPENLVYGDYVFQYGDDGSVVIKKYTGNDAEVIIPDRIRGMKVTRLGSESFSECGNLRSVIIPEGVVRIGSEAFSGCRQLEKVVLPESLFRIGSYAFDGCEKLEEITIPRNVSEIGSNPFTCCSALRMISVRGHSFLAIVDGALVDKRDHRLIYYPLSASEKSYKVPEEIEIIGEYAFSGCSALRSITLRYGVKSIETMAFENCRALEEVDLPDGLEFVGECAFWECAGLKKVFIPEGVAQIGEYAFYDCDKLEKVYIPSSVKDMGMSVFSECEGVTVYTPADSAAEQYCRENGVKFTSDMDHPEKIFFFCGDYQYYIQDDGSAEIVNYAGKDEEISLPEMLGGRNVAVLDFSMLPGNVISVEIPETVIRIEGNPFRDAYSLTTIYVSPDNPVFAAVNGVLYNKEEKKLICYPRGREETTFSIPQGVRKIGINAFESCALKEIRIPDSVTEIEIEAFYGCDGFEDFVIPESVTDVGQKAFTACKGLLSFTIPGSLTYIPEGMLQECENLRRVTIMDGVKKIGNSVFAECYDLEEVNIPDSVTAIEDGAFSICTSLKTITILGNVTRIGESAFVYCEDLIITVARDSYAAKYCKKNKLKYVYPDSEDWLNE